jgi:hypothetical protein
MGRLGEALKRYPSFVPFGIQFGPLCVDEQISHSKSVRSLHKETTYCMSRRLCEGCRSTFFVMAVVVVVVVFLHGGTDTFSLLAAIFQTHMRKE